MTRERKLCDAVAGLQHYETVMRSTKMPLKTVAGTPRPDEFLVQRRGVTSKTVDRGAACDPTRAPDRRMARPATFDRWCDAIAGAVARGGGLVHAGLNDGALANRRPSRPAMRLSGRMNGELTYHRAQIRS
jgi:hypothetical protein